MCIKSYNKKFFVEMIFHFLLTNDLFHRRGQKMVPIHFCNYIHQGCNILAYIEIHLLPSFKLFAQTAQLNHFLHDCFAL